MFATDDPSRLIGQCLSPILSPEEYYERVGDVNNVVFTCGAVLLKEKREVLIYYGAADTSICVATAKLDSLIENAMEKTY